MGTAALRGSVVLLRPKRTEAITVSLAIRVLLAALVEPQHLQVVLLMSRMAAVVATV